ncbi:MAG: PD-(D/E)XK nuclease family protein [Gammaproteobacteria bacterium]|nr:PD-(D/E)XK nuclease family protein [Gammaproteobacteria bacterium]MBT8111545.1 PD-(D/E)XK nuclease family protein [Gammaproteobacteria bacterium]NND47058.1 hypothetical protein [Woeseiaceae bacterium]NNL46243.1 hypothetical protein [Woeseiaceae bacterium]
MYQWLSDALRGPSTVITANRRLARVLREEFAEQQLAAGKVAWQSPAIRSWPDWLDNQLLASSDPASLPTRINEHHSQLLWERCLRKEIGSATAGLSGLVRLSRHTWQRLADWRVTIREVARSATSSDQRLFAAAAGRYVGVLEREHWVDDAGLGALVEGLIGMGRVAIPGRVTFVGFDRDRPLVESIIKVLAENGCDVGSAPVPKIAGSVALQCFETADAEMRAAGAWARQLLGGNPDLKIAIIAGDLEQQAQHKTHRVREGLVPGWQYAPVSAAQAVNVSYGRKLADYPAVSVSLLLLQWLVRDLPARDIGHLLRTPLIGSASTGGRSALELRLRQLPDRNWSPAMLSAALRGRKDDTDVAEWRRVVASITKRRRELPQSASPAEWAVCIDEFLKLCQWPGTETLSSFDFQLVNRWRELLNDLARLDLVSPAMSCEAAVHRLEVMAAGTVFQPESEGRAVQLMGPLEASGAEFDAVWISGLSAANWPPPGNASPLVSRLLQRQKGMPDAEPADTLAYAQRLLLRLGSSAKEVVCSYALTEDDAEQSASGLLPALAARREAAQKDPGWHAATLSKRSAAVVVQESVPKITADEHVSGGAGTIQRQMTDPIAAFIVGRLGVRNLQAQAVGLPALLRGNIIHDALHQLYIDAPSRSDIDSWSGDEMRGRIAAALDAAFARHERESDGVLMQLLNLERNRVGGLLQRFVAVDLGRGEFSIAAVEHAVGFAEAGVRLQLRVDRIDRLPDETLVILDYKTGAKKKFLQSDGQPREFQLIAYACALDDPVAAVALVNIDSREVSFDGAGRGYTAETDWHDSLADWQRQVRTACKDLSLGDVRINRLQGVRDARYFNLLSRYTELRRDA